MTLKQLLFVVTTATLAAGQRPSFAGFRPIGYPELSTEAPVTEALGNRFGDENGTIASNISTTTQRLPIEANGDRDLIDRLSKLPIDNQPFWFINWQAIEANMRNPQTYPQRPNQFAQPIGPANPAPVTPNTGNGIGNRNPDVTGFVNPNTDVNGSGNRIPEVSGFGNRNPDVTAFINPNQDVTGLVNRNPDVSGFGNRIPDVTGLVNPNQDVSGFGNRNPDVTGFTIDGTSNLPADNNNGADGVNAENNILSGTETPLSPTNNVGTGNTNFGPVVTPSPTAPVIANLGSKFGDESVPDVTLSSDNRPSSALQAGNANEGINNSPVQESIPVLSSLRPPVQNNAGAANPLENVLFNQPMNPEASPINPYGYVMFNSPNVASSASKYPYQSQYGNFRVPIRDTRPSHLPHRYGDDYDFETGIHPHYFNHNQGYYSPHGFVRGGGGYPQEYY